MQRPYTFTCVVLQLFVLDAPVYVKPKKSIFVEIIGL